MTWTAPATATTGQVVTAAFWNAQVRDNLLETSAATATAAGDLVYADAANSMGSRLGIGAAGRLLVSTGSAPVWRGVEFLKGDASYTSTSGGGAGSPTSFTPFDNVNWSSGTDVVVSVTTGTQALVFWGVRAVTSDISAIFDMSYAVSGATTDPASTARSIRMASNNTATSGARLHLQTGLTAGTNTFRASAQSSTGSAVWTVLSPYIGVVAL